MNVSKPAHIKTPTSEKMWRFLSKPFKILPIFPPPCFLLLSWQFASLLYIYFFPLSPPLKHNAVNYLFTSPLNKNALIVSTFLSRLVTLFPEHSLGLCLSHVPLHLMFFGRVFFGPLCLSYLRFLPHCAHLPASISLSFFLSFSVIIFLPFYLTITLTLSVPFFVQPPTPPLHPPPDHKSGCQRPFSFN